MSGFVIAVDGPAASGKGTIADAARRGLRPAGARHRPALPRRRRRRAGAPGGDLDDEAAGARPRRAALDLDRPRRSGLAHPRGGRGGQPGGRASAPCARRCCDFQRAFAAPGRRRGDRRARHRHGHRPRRAGQALRHRRAEVRAPRAAGCSSSAPGEAVDLRGRAGRHPRAATPATPAAPTAPMRPAADAVLLDTTEMTIDAAADAARRIVEAARARWEQSRRAIQPRLASTAAGTSSRRRRGVRRATASTTQSDAGARPRRRGATVARAAAFRKTKETYG